jgi:hypothetical protein
VELGMDKIAAGDKIIVNGTIGRRPRHDNHFSAGRYQVPVTVGK